MVCRMQILYNNKAPLAVVKLVDQGSDIHFIANEAIK